MGVRKVFKPPLKSYSALLFTLSNFLPTQVFSFLKSVVYRDLSTVGLISGFNPREDHRSLLWGNFSFPILIVLFRAPILEQTPCS